MTSALSKQIMYGIEKHVKRLISRLLLLQEMRSRITLEIADMITSFNATDYLTLFQAGKTN